MAQNEFEDPNSAGKFAFDAMRATLGKATDVDSCAALTARVNERMGRTFDYLQEELRAEGDGKQIACRAGCAFCCHLRVSVYPHEAIALFRHLGSLTKEKADGIRAKLQENALRIAKMTRDEHYASNIACGFLVDGRCAAYEARPLACSGYHSLSREECEYSYNNPADLSEVTTHLEVLREIAAAMRDGMEQACEAARLSATSVELQTAVAALIRDPSLVTRWRSGRDLIKLQK
jgi:Fe-S-cluster containining protein